MKLKVNPQIFQDFPGMKIGVLTVRDLNNKVATPQLGSSLAKISRQIRQTLNIEGLSENPKIASWRQIYKKFGSKPNDYRSSIESLCRLILKGKDLRQINPLVDIYNYVSLKHLLPAGGEDLDKIQGSILLTFAGPEEAPISTLGDLTENKPYEGEVIYKDDLSTICRRWNWREAERTKLTEETKNAVLVIEGPEVVTKTELAKALEELSVLTNRYCQGKARLAILDSQNLEFTL